MTMMIKTLAIGAGFAAIAAASPASAQYYPSYGAPYGNAYGYNSHAATNMAAQQCSAAVQQRLSMRGNTNIISQLLGVRNYSNARVLSVTRVVPRAQTVRVTGVASSGRVAAYSPYGAGAYGMLGSNYAPAADLTFRCSVDYRGIVRDIDITRR
jgi:hypothetical protein